MSTSTERHSEETQKKIDEAFAYYQKLSKNKKLQRRLQEAFQKGLELGATLEDRRDLARWSSRLK